VRTEFTPSRQASKPRFVVRGFKQGQNRGQKRATLFTTFFRRKSPSLYAEGICGGKMFCVVSEAEPSHPAKVALFENAADTIGRTCTFSGSFGSPK